MLIIGGLVTIVQTLAGLSVVSSTECAGNIYISFTTYQLSAIAGTVLPDLIL